MSEFYRTISNIRSLRAAARELTTEQLEEALDKVTKLIKTYSDNSLLHNITGACHAGLGQLGQQLRAMRGQFKLIQIMQKHIII